MYFNINKFRYFFILFPGVGGGTFEKVSHSGEVANVLLERGDKPEMGVNVEMGWGRRVTNFLLTYISITFTLCAGKVKCPLLLFSSSVF